MGIKNRFTPPWFRKTSFYFGIIGFLVLYALFILPDPGPIDSVLKAMNISLFVISTLGALCWYISDKFEPEWLKTLCVLVAVGMFGWLFYNFSGADWSSFFRLFLNFDKMKGRYGTFVTPTLLILKIAGISCVYSVLIGLLLAVFRSLKNPVVSWLVSGYVTVFRAFPEMVLLVLVYYSLPFIGIQLSSVNSVIIGISLIYGAYMTEVFRAGLESVSKHQREAAEALGLSELQILRLVVFPQAIRIVIPPLTSQLIGILKTTSISYVVGVVDLITRARQLQAYVMVVTPLLVVSAIYLVIILPFVVLSDYLEKRSRRWVRKAN